MSDAAFRPEVGKPVFVSFLHGKPFLTQVTEYFADPRYQTERFKYVRVSGNSIGSSLLADATFYPDAPSDAEYLYVVVLEQHEFMDKSEESELGFFFDPKSAFDYLDELQAGKVKARVQPWMEFVDYSVRVERVRSNK